MRHGMVFNRLGRDSKHLKAMLRNMTGSLFREEVIKTTVPKAKELQRYAEKVITLGKKGNLHKIKGTLFEKDVQDKLIYDLSARYANRSGGYTRILKVGHRYGDAADIALIELVDRPNEIRPKSKQ